MPLGLGTALWACIVPKETTNLITNPSFELGSTGWSALGGGATIGTTSSTQAFGAWSLQVNHTITSEGAFYTAGTPAAGSYVMTAFFKGTAGHRYRILSETLTGGVLGAGSVTATGGWDTVTAAAGLASGTGLLIVVRHVDSAAGTFYVDGIQLESGTNATSYIDGDQPGGTWTGTPHQSTSTRTSQYRGGGSVIALADLGLSVDQMVGAGVPPIEVSTQSFAVVDGAEFQRQRAAQRKFTLTAKPISGTSLADFHVTRRTLYDAFKPDLVTPQQPITFLYVGGQGTQQLSAYYQSGLELGNMDGPIAESAGVSFIATDPYWYSPTQQGTTLGPRVSLGSVKYIARRNALGAWGTMGVAGTTITASTASASGITAIRSLAVNPGGTVFLGGWFGSVGGTLSPNVGMYYPNSNTFGTLTGGTTDQTNGQLLGVTFNPAGTLFLCGLWTTIAGTSTNHIAQWTGNYGSLVGGTVAALNYVWSLLYSPYGSLFLGGDFLSVAGTSNANSLAFWNGAGYGTLGGTARNGASEAIITSLAWGLDNRLYFGGGITTIMGTQGTAIGQWTGAGFGTLQNPVASGAGAGIMEQLSIGPDGRLWEAGQITNIAIGSAPGAMVWNGIQQSNIGSGFGFQSGFNASSESWSVLADQDTGNVFFGGVFSKVGGINVAANYTTWNGYTFLPPDLGFVGGGFTLGTVYAMIKDTLGNFYVAGNFVGTAYAASVGTIVNDGRSQAYPSLRLRNLGAGTARIYQLLNTTTNAGIYLNYVMLGGESALLTLTPGRRSFQSSARGNIFGLILPGSNLSTFSLLSGTNYISFFADSGSVEASFFWQPRGWSIDSGTIQ